MPNGPRRKAENMSSPVPVSASICAGFMGTRQAICGPKVMLMRLAAVGLWTLLSIPAFAAEPERRPGYGVVRKVYKLNDRDRGGRFP